MWKKVIVFLSSLIFFCLNFIPVYANKTDVIIDFFWAEGCPHCAHEKIFLDELKIKYPDLQINSYEISKNQTNINLLQQKGRQLSADVSGVPFTVIGSNYVSGFGTKDTTGKQIEDLIKQNLSQEQIEKVQRDLVSIHLPFIGEINAKQMSLPILTLAIALVDGFNPCAMWTLLFLISLLLGMKNRKRMWILGIAFIVSSAFVYFLFLAAWLNLFIFLGLVIWVRVIIALVALVAGAINLKEYIENKSGCKIMGDEKRQKFFEKLKSVTSKKNFILALGGIILLAFAVNLVELICSAGLPAIYTKILSMYQLPTWQYYLYLIFYIFVFMIDDLFVFFTAMVTLQAVGIQSKYTKASHLVGEIIMLIIGLLMLFKPDILMFG